VVNTRGYGHAGTITRTRRGTIAPGRRPLCQTADGRYPMKSSTGNSRSVDDDRPGDRAGGRVRKPLAEAQGREWNCDRRGNHVAISFECVDPPPRSAVEKLRSCDHIGCAVFVPIGNTADRLDLVSRWIRPAPENRSRYPVPTYT
jgi:hypothetical protein